MIYKKEKEDDEKYGSVLVMGPSGVGKSTLIKSFINDINIKINDGYSQTFKCEYYKDNLRKIYFIDTIGFNDFQQNDEILSDNKIFIDILKFLHKNNTIITCVILMLNEFSRITESLELYIKFANIYNQEIIKRTIVLFPKLKVNDNIFINFQKMVDKNIKTKYNMIYNFDKFIDIMFNFEKDNKGSYDISNLCNYINYFNTLKPYKINWNLKTCKKCKIKMDPRIITEKCLHHEYTINTHSGPFIKYHNGKIYKKHDKEINYYLKKKTLIPIAGQIIGLKEGWNYGWYDCCNGESKSEGCIEYYDCCLLNINIQGCQDYCQGCGEYRYNSGCKTICSKCCKPLSERPCSEDEIHDFEK